MDAKTLREEAERIILKAGDGPQALKNIIDLVQKAAEEERGKVLKLEGVLREIASNPWEDNALDPQWAARVAAEYLPEKKESKSTMRRIAAQKGEGAPEFDQPTEGNKEKKG